MKTTIPWVCFVLLSFFSACATYHEAEPKTAATLPQDPDGVALQLLTRGKRLSKDQAKELEERLTLSPNDIESHIVLIGYYSQYKSRPERLSNILWLIENDPANAALHHPPTRLEHLNNEDYVQASSLWKKQTLSHSKEPLVLRNAIQFFWSYDKEHTLSLLEIVEKLEPKNPEWKQQLGRLHSTKSESVPEEQHHKEASLALEKFEEAYKLTQLNSPELAQAAFAAGEWKKAQTYASELLSTHHPMDGEAVFYGNLILGRLALLQGDINSAKTHLLEAGKTPGSPNLNSFGPSMSLAKELLQVGETEVVLAYFELCAVFWKSGTRKLAQWTDIVLAGEMPDFGTFLLL